MPEPITSFSTDKYVYDYLCNPLAKHLCWLHPNDITLLGLLTIIPILKNLYNNEPVDILVMWLVIRAVLDCLDGAVARQCNKESKEGAIFDITSDLLCASLIALIVVTKLWNTKFRIVSVLVSISLLHSLVINWYHTVHGNDKIGLSSNDIGIATLFHDNTVLIAIVGPLLIKYVLNLV